MDYLIERIRNGTSEYVGREIAVQLCDALIRERERRSADNMDRDRAIRVAVNAFELANADAGARAKRFRAERNKWKSTAKRYAKALKANGIELPTASGLVPPIST